MYSATVGPLSAPVIVTSCSPVTPSGRGLTPVTNRVPCTAFIPG
ncbi:Uncharacterised protein [Mycobacteroides abscessus subsp. abscessus]|nr:Uncharacterised protein [Mycobacteroides abscessus subsp. abscessus]SKU31982.1 Uncharacterised protein [Mycobacteroides abscessus subsp. abscessus]